MLIIIFVKHDTNMHAKHTSLREHNGGLDLNKYKCPLLVAFFIAMLPHCLGSLMLSMGGCK